jgi:general transcription factor 3C polypeptide 3 (transcription factor C subunit 4)
LHQQVLNKHCGLVFNNKIIDEIDLEEAESMELTEELPLDIIGKLSIALLYANKEEFAFPLIEAFLEHDVESFGDIFLDVAEALIEKKFYQQAL